jgi:hypothetical protein
MCVTMKPRRNEEAQAHIGLSSHGGGGDIRLQSSGEKNPHKSYIFFEGTVQEKISGHYINWRFHLTRSGGWYNNIIGDRYTQLHYLRTKINKNATCAEVIVRKDKTHAQKNGYDDIQYNKYNII